jgi:hypothetical protein
MNILKNFKTLSFTGWWNLIHFIVWKDVKQFPHIITLNVEVNKNNKNKIIIKIK